MRSVTLFTGQWADLPLETLCQQAVEFGYDGLELACWGDHFEVDQATDAYCEAKRELLAKHDLALFSHFQPPRRPSRVRRHRQPPRGYPAPRASSATAPQRAYASARPQR